MFKSKLKSMKGFSLVEVLVAVAIMVTVGVALLSALGTSSKILRITDSSETARDLAVAQIEHIKSEPYNVSSYSVDPDLFTVQSGYSATIAVTSLQPDGSIQRITVSVFQGSSSTPVYTLEGYRMRS
jgi:prepilin-type N-terminal cleavage/methylation domain-containing protein